MGGVGYGLYTITKVGVSIRTLLNQVKNADML